LTISKPVSPADAAVVGSPGFPVQDAAAHLNTCPFKRYGGCEKQILLSISMSISKPVPIADAAVAPR
jgi:hypothetical protein